MGISENARGHYKYIALRFSAAIRWRLYKELLMSIWGIGEVSVSAYKTVSEDMALIGNIQVKGKPKVLASVTMK